MGTTLPEEPNTLPNRTAMNRVPVGWAAKRDCTHISARRLANTFPAQCPANAPARPGHHHYSIQQQAPDFFAGQLHLLAAEQILDLDGLQLADFGLASGQFVDGRNGAEFDLEPLQGFG